MATTKKTVTKKKAAVSPRKVARATKAIKTAIEELLPTKAEKIYEEGQQIAKRGKPKAQVKVLSTEEQMMRHWAVYDGIINGTVNARTGIDLLEHGPLGQLRLVESQERDNGKRKKRRLKVA